MKKFAFALTQGSEYVISERTKVATEEGEVEAQNIVRALEADVRNIKVQLLNETDIYPSSKLSTEAVKAGFNAKSMFRNIQALKTQLEIKERELTIANETYQEWFGDDFVAPVVKKGKKVVKEDLED